MAESSPVLLTFGVVSGSRRAERDLAAVSEALSRSMPVPCRGVLVPSYDALREGLEAERLQLVWAPPLVALDLESARVGAIALSTTRAGRTTYDCAIFTAHTSRVERLEDLAGCHMGWVDKRSAAGYRLPRQHLTRAGLALEGLFGEETFFGTHADVAAAVLDGRADAGATYLSLDRRTGLPLSAGWMEAGAAGNGACVLATVGPIPSDTIVVGSAVPAAYRHAVEDAFLALGTTSSAAVGSLFGADGFAVPDPADFAALRALGES